jgi:hypothetical protein
MGWTWPRSAFGVVPELERRLRRHRQCPQGQLAAAVAIVWKEGDHALVCGERVGEQVVCELGRGAEALGAHREMTNRLALDLPFAPASSPSAEMVGLVHEHENSRRPLPRWKCRVSDCESPRTERRVQHDVRGDHVRVAPGSRRSRPAPDRVCDPLLVRRATNLGLAKREDRGDALELGRSLVPRGGRRRGEDGADGEEYEGGTPHAPTIAAVGWRWVVRGLPHACREGAPSSLGAEPQVLYDSAHVWAYPARPISSRMPEALSKQETKCAFADAQKTHKRPTTSCVAKPRTKSKRASEQRKCGHAPLCLASRRRQMRHCSSRAALHFDHVMQRTWGGSGTAEKAQILCRECNYERARASSTEAPREHARPAREAELSRASASSSVSPKSRETVATCQLRSYAPGASPREGGATPSVQQ